MMPATHVVVATPAPGRGNGALVDHVVSRGASFARAARARLTLLHAVVTPLPTVGAEVDVDAVGALRALDVAQRRALDASLAGLRARLAPDLDAHVRIVDAGADAAEALREEAERLGGDLLIVGPRARGASPRLGSVALRLICAASVPVLLLRGPE